MGCTYVKEFSFGGKVTPTAAVHKHEEALHPGKPMTKMAKGGSVKPSKGVQGPFMAVKRRDANQLTKIY